MSTLTIGLTGGIGSGKTFVSDYFKKLGANIVDADVLARQLTEPKQPALANITAHFGPEVIKGNGCLDRSKLRNIIFNNSSEKKWLEELLHPMVRSSIVHQLNQPFTTYHILSSPLLFETHQDQLVNYTLTVDASEATQLKRASLRDGSKPKLIQSIIDAQMKREKRVGLSDFVISNEGGKEDTMTNIKNMHQHFLSLANDHKLSRK